MCHQYVVYRRLSMTRVYCDKAAEVKTTLVLLRSTSLAYGFVSASYVDIGNRIQK